MLKKLLLLGLLLSSQGLHAFTVVTHHGEDYLKINPNFKNERRTDWIGVYKKGTSQSWENVLQWHWVTDLLHEDEFYIEDLTPNNYVIRYFKNNSFKISDEYELNIDANEKPKIFNKVHEYLDGSLLVRLKNLGENPGKDWIGYYKKGSSTAWKNVIKWHWVKDLTCSFPDECHDALPPEDLAVGDYEIRYFKNNSYTIEGQPLSFTIKKVNSTLESINAYSNDKGYINMKFNGLGKFLQPNPKDWIGLYEANDSNAWGNVVKWVWAKDITLKIHDKRYNDAYYVLKNIKAGRYEVRYFLNNTFKTHAKSKPFIVK